MCREQARMGEGEHDLMESVCTHRLAQNANKGCGKSCMEAPHPPHASWCLGNKAHLATVPGSPVPSPCCPVPQGPVVTSAALLAPALPSCPAPAAQLCSRAGSLRCCPQPRNATLPHLRRVAGTPSAVQGEGAGLLSHSRQQRAKGANKAVIFSSWRKTQCLRCRLFPPVVGLAQ